MPADLNWVRLEEWRIATASMFDSPQMRQRLGQLRAIRVQAVGADGPFGDRVRALLYIAWIECVLGREISASIGSMERSGRGDIVSVALEFDSGGRVVIDRIEPHGVIVARAEAMEDAWPTVTRYSDPTSVELIVRQLSRRDEDVMYPRVLPIAAVLARRL
jgi:glucose-6-phosphate dehydrogenase assembly protein OpcA